MFDIFTKFPIVAPYLIIISIVAVIVTIKDKVSAKIDARRTPEKTLLLISALGGSCAMLLTMLLIRHKTRHIKFMLGIPLMLVLQAGIIYYLYSLGILI